jgi:thymidylate kinase
MIIFEGADGAGKSTLARIVARRLLDTERLKRFECYGLLPTWWDYCHHYMVSCQRFAVLDRFIVSEFVYGRLWRGGPNVKLTQKNVGDVADRMDAARSLTVYVRPEYDVCLNRLKQRGDPLLDHKDLRDVYKMYDEYLLRKNCVITGSPVMVVTAQDGVFEIDSIMSMYERRVAE